MFRVKAVHPHICMLCSGVARVFKWGGGQILKKGTCVVHE